MGVSVSNSLRHGTGNLFGRTGNFLGGTGKTSSWNREDQCCTRAPDALRIAASIRTTGFLSAVGQSSTQSITLCGVEGEDIGDGTDTLPRLRPGRRGPERLWIGPESLRELFDTLRVIGPSEVKAKMEALRSLGVLLDK